MTYVEAKWVVGFEKDIEQRFEDEAGRIGKAEMAGTNKADGQHRQLDEVIQGLVGGQLRVDMHFMNRDVVGYQTKHGCHAVVNG